MAFRIRFHLEFALRVDGFKKPEIFKDIGQKELKEIREKIDSSEIDSLELQKKVAHLFGEKKLLKKKDLTLIIAVTGCALTLLNVVLQIVVM